MDANAFDISRHSDAEPASERKPSTQAPEFRVKPGARVRARDAALLAGVMARLVTEERGTPQALLDEARAVTSPIHHCFEWNDKAAAHAHRLRQASKYWGSIELVIVAEDSTEKPLRAFHPVFVDSERRYESIGTISQTESLLDQLVAQAKKDLIAFKHRYQSLRDAGELAEVFAAIGRVEARK